MYDFILTLHNLTRWIVLIAGIVATVTAIIGWVKKKEWTATDNKMGLIYTISFDIQLLLGLMLYLWLSPLTKLAFEDFGAAMADDKLRFFAVEHFSMMLLALILAHVGRVLSKKAAGTKKFMWAAILFGISIILVLGSIPWFRPLL
jgi:hypothetical protein